MVKFALNSSMSVSTGYAPFELNYGYIPQLGQCLRTDTMFVGVKQFAQQALWNVMMAHDAIIASCVMWLPINLAADLLLVAHTAGLAPASHRPVAFLVAAPAVVTGRMPILEFLDQD